MGEGWECAVTCPEQSGGNVVYPSQPGGRTHGEGVRLYPWHTPWVGVAGVGLYPPHTWKVRPVSVSG